MNLPSKYTIKPIVNFEEFDFGRTKHLENALEDMMNSPGSGISEIKKTQAIAGINGRAYHISVPKLLSAISQSIAPLVAFSDSWFVVGISFLATINGLVDVPKKLKFDEAMICQLLLEAEPRALSLSEIEYRMRAHLGQEQSFGERVNKAIDALIDLGVVDVKNEVVILKEKLVFGRLS